MRPLRIAMIGAKGIPATVGGVERIVEELGARLAERGHEVTVYCRRRYTEESGDAALWRGMRRRWAPCLPGKYTDTITHASAALLDALGRRFDLVHLHSLGTAPCLLLARLGRRPTLFHIHGQEWKGGKWGWGARGYFRAAERLALSIGPDIVVNTRASLDYYRSAFGREVDYIPNAADIPPHRETAVLAELGVAPRGYLLFVGRLVPEKGCHHLLEAHRRLKLTLPIVVAGEPAHSEAYARQLRAMADGATRFAGRVTGERLTDLYARSLVVVNPTERDAVSLVLLEAMGQGACVVTSDIPEMLEGVGGCGYHHRSGDPADLARVLGGLLAEPERIERVREPARRRVQTEYAWPGIVDRFEALYARALGD